MEKIKVAIADDNKELVGLMEEYINVRPNMEVVATAFNGKACLEMMEQADLDILVLDLIMPYLDGIAVLDAIKENAKMKNISVIMLSAFGQESIMQQAAKYGASYFIMKPFELECLIGQMERVVEERRSGKSAEADINEAVLRLMREIGIPPHIKGFTYLKEAIGLVYLDTTFLDKVTKQLYPSIAERFETTATRVERSIRHAIELLWKNGNPEDISAALGYSERLLTAKPSNSQFIAMVADRVRQQKQ